MQQHKVVAESEALERQKSALTMERTLQTSSTQSQQEEWNRREKEITDAQEELQHTQLRVLNEQQAIADEQQRLASERTSLEERRNQMMERERELKEQIEKGTYITGVNSKVGKKRRVVEEEIPEPLTVASADNSQQPQLPTSNVWKNLAHQLAAPTSSEERAGIASLLGIHPDGDDKEGDDDLEENDEDVDNNDGQLGIEQDDAVLMEGRREIWDTE